MSESPSSRLILASASPRRRELLLHSGLEFSVQAADIDESLVRGSANEVCVELSIRKAEHVAGLHEGGAHVIGSDTVVAILEDGIERILGKPKNDDHAREMLERLSGRVHRVCTGVAMATSGGKTRAGIEVSEVTFRELGADEINAYISSSDHEGKAGAYGIQSEGLHLVREIRGCYYNIVGLPLSLVARLLPGNSKFISGCDCSTHLLQRGQASCGGRVIV